MKYHRIDNLLLCSHDKRDLKYVQAVSELVLDHYHGEGPRWCPNDPDRLWKVFVGGRSAVVGTQRDGRVSCVKLFYDKRVRTCVRTALGAAKGRRAYRNGLRLARSGVHCPRMIGYAEKRPIGPCLIVTELIEDGMRLDHWALQHGIQCDIIIALARFLRDMHDRGVSHVDLSPRNILIRKHAQRIDFLLLDYEDARFASRVARRIRIDNIHHLHERSVPYVSVRDRLRFLHAYAGDAYIPYRNALRRMIRRSTRVRLQGTADPVSRKA